MTISTSQTVRRDALIQPQVMEHYGQKQTLDKAQLEFHEQFNSTGRKGLLMDKRVRDHRGLCSKRSGSHVRIINALSGRKSIISGSDFKRAILDCLPKMGK